MDKQPPINFYMRDDGIAVFEFFRMDREAATVFAKIINASAKTRPDKVRALYDFSQSPPPTPYFLQIQADLYRTYPHPTDEKSAYIADTSNAEVWVRIARSYIRSIEEMKVFSTRDDAIAWLLE